MARTHGIRCFQRNKKGSLLDIIFIAIGMLIFAVTILVAFKVVSEWNKGINAHGDIPTEALASTQRLSDTFTTTIDGSALILCIGMTLGAFILASLVRVHPIFLVFFFIALVFVIFFSAVFSNVYMEMAENPSLSAEADQLTFISYILKFLPFIVGILGTILAVVMHKMWSNAQL